MVRPRGSLCLSLRLLATRHASLATNKPHAPSLPPSPHALSADAAVPGPVRGGGGGDPGLCLFRLGLGGARSRPGGGGGRAGGPDRRLSHPRPRRPEPGPGRARHPRRPLSVCAEGGGRKDHHRQHLRRARGGRYGRLGALPPDRHRRRGPGAAAPVDRHRHPAGGRRTSVRRGRHRRRRGLSGPPDPGPVGRHGPGHPAGPCGRPLHQPPGRKRHGRAEPGRLSRAGGGSEGPRPDPPFRRRA